MLAANLHHALFNSLSLHQEPEHTTIKAQSQVSIITITTKIIIIITRPKPPSGRQGLARSWGKDTVRQVHYKMFSMSHFAPTALSSNWILLFKCGYKNSLVITKIPPGTVQNHENPPINTKNQPTFYFLLSTFYILPFTFYFLLSTFYSFEQGCWQRCCKGEGGDNDNCKGLAHRAPSSGSQFGQQSKNDANTSFENMYNCTLLDMLQA